MRRTLGTSLTALALSALALTGCSDQPEEANDNGPQPDATQPAGVVRTPASDPSAPVTVPLPGETNSPDVSGDVAEETPSS